MGVGCELSSDGSELVGVGCEVSSDGSEVVGVSFELSSDDSEVVLGGNWRSIVYSDPITAILIVSDVLDLMISQIS